MQRPVIGDIDVVRNLGKPWHTWIKVGLQHTIKELHANLCKDWATDRSAESETMKAGIQTDVYCTWKH